MATYDLNAIADALAAVWQGQDTWAVDGQMVPLTVYSEVPGQVAVPALAIELDDMSWDVSMDRGADTAMWLVHLIVENADSTSAQRAVRRALSTGSTVDKLKDRLVQNQTLGGLVAYAHMSGTRAIGEITYGGVAYQGATIEVGMMLQ